MTASIELENYRGFEKYRLDGLSRVNLLVGGNNCGKTAILEAVHFLASGGDPAVLMQIASQRGEVTFVRDENPSLQNAYPTVLHFFHNRVFGPGSMFSIRGAVPKLDGLIEARVIPREDVDINKSDFHGEVSLQQAHLFGNKSPLGVVYAFCIKGPGLSQELAFPMSDEGIMTALSTPWISTHLPRSRDSSTKFVSIDSLSTSSMRGMWDSVLEQGREDEVISAMQILEPDLSGLFFLQGASSAFGSQAGGVIASFKDARQRTPLGSHGEGMRRLLALSLALVQCKGGVLLIDEIDTGLHYSVMGDMWRLVVEAARQADVQVFATTHSSDCVRGLAWLCQNHPELGEEVSLQKIVPELDKAVGFDAEGIVSTDQHDIEVR